MRVGDLPDTATDGLREAISSTKVGTMVARSALASVFGTVQGSLSGLGVRSPPANEQNRLDDQKRNGDTHQQCRQRVGTVLSPAVISGR